MTGTQEILDRASPPNKLHEMIEGAKPPKPDGMAMFGRFMVLMAFSIGGMFITAVVVMLTWQWYGAPFLAACGFSVSATVGYWQAMAGVWMLQLVRWIASPSGGNGDRVRQLLSDSDAHAEACGRGIGGPAGVLLLAWLASFFFAGVV